MSTLAQTSPARGLMRLVPLLVLAAVAMIPLMGNGYVTYMACLILINIIATIGLNITVGYAGLLSIGHAAFVGMGAYVCALATMAGIPLLIALALGAAAAFVMGIVFGLPALRIKGVHLAISTLAMQFTFYFIAQRWTAVTNGDNGLQPPQPELFGLVLDSDEKLFYLILPFAILSTILAANIFKTRLGRAFLAIRERDYAAEVLGVSAVHSKLMAFALGAAFAGLAGGLLAMFLRLVSPDQFIVSVSVFYLTAVLVGGRGSLLGSILGATFMTLIPEILREVVAIASGGSLSVASTLATFREFLFGALIVIFLHVDPRGLVGIIEKFGVRIEFRGV